MEEWDPEEDLRSVGVIGVYRHYFRVARARGEIVARIALRHGLPLAVLFLAHVAITHAIFSRMHVDEAAIDGSSSEALLIVRDVADWVALVLAYLSALLFLSLISTAAVVFRVASLYTTAAKHDDLYFHRVIRAFPVVRTRRLINTFFVAFGILSLYNGVFISVLLRTVLLLYRHHGTLLTSLALVGGAVYLAGLVYTGVVWHLASVVSVLEDAHGLAAMRKSRALLAGKLWTVAAIFAMLSGLSFAVETGFKAVVVENTMRLGLGYRALFGLATVAALCTVIMVALVAVAQAVVYFVCKSYHGESVDRAHLSDHLGEYQPLDDDNDNANNGAGGVQMEVQMEQLP